MFIREKKTTCKSNIFKKLFLNIAEAICPLFMVIFIDDKGKNENVGIYCLTL